ncbi:WD40 repeat-like protein [Microstroma glucosiphilum]|uniref:WD40 repeat-like protein n=1 Tax=Pseudomicrostroma glucosiphilum TaxID=1684307 RepID=A0A316TX00_9BASI|nr:WD40 repeat-like protein [Pseudomicrostroma glucosiphilum]PWN17952.1 WD40 repeat-like protein [Pseudomicrostroma glucosiphilum]
MSFLFALSPFKALHPSSPPTSTTPQDHIENQGRRRLARSHPNCTSSNGSATFSSGGLASPFKTPSKSSSAESSMRNGDAAESSAMAQQRQKRSTSTFETDSGYEGDGNDDDRPLESGQSRRILGIGQKSTRIDFLAHLPHEVAHLIVLHLPDHLALLSVGLVSTAWRAIANDTLVWRDFFHRNPGWALREDLDVEEYLAAIDEEDLLVPSDQLAELQNMFEARAMGFEDVSGGSLYKTPTKAQRGKSRSAASQLLMATSPLKSPDFAAGPSPGQLKWSFSTPGRKRYEGHSEATEAPQERLLDRLDWRRVYAARYRLASRFGEVGWAPAPVASRSSGSKQSARTKKLKERDRQIREDWEEDEDVASAVSSRGEDEDETTDSDDPERIARREAEDESFVAAATRSPKQVGKAKSSTRVPLRPQLATFRQLGSHLDYIYCLRVFPSYRSYSPCPGQFVTGSKDHRMRVWDIQTGKCLHVIKGHQGSVLALDVDADGEVLVSGSSDRMLGIWSWFGCAEAVAAAKEGRSWSPTLLDRWDCHVPVMDVRLTPDYLVLGLKNGQVRSYTRNPNNRAEFKKCAVYKKQQCSLNDMKVQGHFVAAGFALGATELIDLRTGECVRSFQQFKGVACIEYDGDILISGASDGIIRCWKASTGQLLMVLGGHEQLPRSLFFDSKRGMLISVGYDGILNIWDVTLLIDTDLVEACALGDSWHCLGRQFQKQKRWAEEAQQRKDEDMLRIKERVEAQAALEQGTGQGRGVDSPSTSLTLASTSATRTGGISSRSKPRNTAAVFPRPHPLADPPKPYRPRWSTRLYHGRVAPAGTPAPIPAVLPASPGQRHIQGRAGTAPPGTAQPPHLRDHDEPQQPQPQQQQQQQHQIFHPQSHPNPCRLFDVAFDGKRIIVVGDLQEVSVYEFLDKGERDWLGWEIFK